MIQISVLPNGNYSIVYESTGEKFDIENNDFLHPANNDAAQWITTIDQNQNNDFVKKTINIKPITEKLVFSDKKALNYFINIEKNEYFALRDRRLFPSAPPPWVPAQPAVKHPVHPPLRQIRNPVKAPWPRVVRLSPR